MCEPAASSTVREANVSAVAKTPRTRQPYGVLNEDSDQRRKPTPFGTVIVQVSGSTQGSSSAGEKVG
jgi:hypothetical protein